MTTITFNTVDAAILSAVFAIMVLIVRGMLRGTIRSCDPSSCGGNCHSCKLADERPQLHLSESQLSELATIDRRAKEAGLR